MNLTELRMEELEILEQQRDVVNSRIAEIKDELHEEYVKLKAIFEESSYEETITERIKSIATVKINTSKNKRSSKEDNYIYGPEEIVVYPNLKSRKIRRMEDKVNDITKSFRSNVEFFSWFYEYLSEKHNIARSEFDSIAPQLSISDKFGLIKNILSDNLVDINDTLKDITLIGCTTTYQEPQQKDSISSEEFYINKNEAFKWANEHIVSKPKDGGSVAELVMISIRTGFCKLFTKGAKAPTRKAADELDLNFTSVSNAATKNRVDHYVRHTNESETDTFIVVPLKWD